jgi:hypothetical protein
MGQRSAGASLHERFRFCVSTYYVTCPSKTCVDHVITIHDVEITSKYRNDRLPPMFLLWAFMEKQMSKLGIVGATALSLALAVATPALAEGRGGGGGMHAGGGGMHAGSGGMHAGGRGGGMRVGGGGGGGGMHVGGGGFRDAQASVGTEMSRSLLNYVGPTLPD